jgi:hypothetical protein
MDEEQLYRILEESINNVLGTVEPNLPNIVNSMREAHSERNHINPLQIFRDMSFNNIIDISNNISNNDLSINHIDVATSTSNTFPTENTPLQYTNDVSRNVVYTAPVRSMMPMPMQTSNNLDRFYELFDTHSHRWYRFAHDYDENMRRYQENTLQMIRISQTLTRTMQSFRNQINPPPTRTNPFNSLLPLHVRDFLQRNNIDFDVESFSVPYNSMFQNNTEVSHPTITQIMNATERFINNETNEERIQTNTQCPITLEEFLPDEELCQIKQCQHIFKWSSLQTWFSRNSVCPVCRYDIREYT